MLQAGGDLLGINLAADNRSLPSASRQPALTQWDRYEGHDLFVMGNVSAAYLVDTAGELLQAP